MAGVVSDVGVTSSNDVTADEFERECRLYEFIVCTIMIGAFCVFGLVGNVTSFVVFRKHKDSAGAIFLLQCMAVVDSLLLVVAIVVYSLPSVYPYTGRLKTIYDSFDYIVYVWPPAMVFHTVTIWLTVLVTVNRYNAVCRAVEEFGTRTVRRAQIQVVVVVTMAALYNIPRFFEHQVISTESGESANAAAIFTYSGYNNSSQAAIANGVSIEPLADAKLVLGDNRIYQVIYSNIVYYPVMYIFPLVTLMTLNLKLVAALNLVHRRTFVTGRSTSPAVVVCGGGGGGRDRPTSRTTRHRRRGRHQRHHDNITHCVVVIVFVFIVCQTPALFNQIFWAVFDPGDRECGHFHFYYTKLSDLLVVVNSSCNFVVYFLFGRTFRRIFLATVCGGLSGSSTATTAASSTCYRSSPQRRDRNAGAASPRRRRASDDRGPNNCYADECGGVGLDESFTRCSETSPRRTPSVAPVDGSRLRPPPSNVHVVVDVMALQPIQSIQF